MLEHKQTIHSPLNNRLRLFGLFFKAKPAARSRLSETAEAKSQQPKDFEPFPPETDPKILIEHYAHLGRGPL